jgi:hypothetical protein
VSLDLEAEAAAIDTPYSAQCTVCAFIAAQPPDEQPAYDALLAGPRKPRTVWRVLKAHGYTQTDGPVYNHRNAGHRR